MEIAIEELTAFLYDAKRHSYAAGTKAATLPDGRKRFTVQQGNLFYEDTYIGLDAEFTQFMGAEIVRKNGSVIWMMQYDGGIIPLGMQHSGTNVDQVYDMMLRPALQQMPKDVPIRGPASLELTVDDDWEHSYGFKLREGDDITNFRGQESIRRHSVPVYSLTCRGGMRE
jgi:hypothetical protein